MAWNYAELSMWAKNNGGPDKLVSNLVEYGKSIGRNQIFPWVGIAFAGGITITITVQKAIHYFSKKKVISPIEAEATQKELVRGINEYDFSRVVTPGDIEK